MLAPSSVRATCWATRHGWIFLLPLASRSVEHASTRFGLPTLPPNWTRGCSGCPSPPALSATRIRQCLVSLASGQSSLSPHHDETPTAASLDEHEARCLADLHHSNLSVEGVGRSFCPDPEK
jgi:hypothetical protein